MTDIDDLLDELTRARPEPSAPPTSAPALGPERKRRRWPLAAAGLVLALLAGVGAAALTVGASDDAARSPVTGSTAADGRATTTSTSVAAAATSTTLAADTVEPGGADASANADGAVRYATVSGGRILLRGAAPGGTAARLVASLGDVTGVPVADELVVTAAALAETPVPVYFADRILFGFNSIEVAAGDLWQLEVAARLLASHPELKLHIVARTDAVGTDEQNRQVAEQRATAICNYLLSIGASPDQIVLDPIGEAEETHEPDDDPDAAPDRHAELVMEGTLTG